MGCKLSTDQSVGRHDPVNMGSGETKRFKGIGGTERMIHDELQRKNPTGTNGGSGTVPNNPLVVEEDSSGGKPKVNDKGQLMPEEVVRRTSSSLNVSNFKLGNKGKGGKEIQVSFAYRSQRGYYPDDPTKANQDRYGITLNLAGEDGDALFSVYDGHGEQGHKAAAFAKQALPKSFAKYLRSERVKQYKEELQASGNASKPAFNPKLWPLLDADAVEKCARKSFLETNKAMHSAKSVDDKYSGAVASSVFFHGGRMTVCNVGDCRVVLGHRVSKVDATDDSKEEEKRDIETELGHLEHDEEGHVLAIPLTRDQTPYRRDERERVRKEGAEVKSIDQLEGRLPMHDDWGDMVLGERIDIKGDLPRLYVPDKEYPGTAFTRSLGDRLAEDIGVNADPEMVTADLTANDEFLIIASDGIFEFLTNQEVVDICATSMNPLEACERLNKEAYAQWLIHEDRTDDITVIVCFLNCQHKPTVEEEGETTESLVSTVEDSYGSKPLTSMHKPMTTGVSSKFSLGGPESPTLGVLTEGKENTP